ncbi:MAG: hypothetical protein IPQ13_00925 [Holophagaceae bacterium]|nr:hypothetical protein [Holophagaceae bacterium]
MMTSGDGTLEGLRARRPPTFKQLKWKLTFATLGLVLLAFACLALFGLFDLQRTSAAAVEQREWPRLRQMVDQMQDDEGAKALYLQVGGRIQGCSTEADFLRLVAQVRPKLEPLPSHVPRALWGRATCTVQDRGKARLAWIAYRNSKGLRIATKWENGSLLALSLDWTE